LFFFTIYNRHRRLNDRLSSSAHQGAGGCRRRAAPNASPSPSPPLPLRLSGRPRPQPIRRRLPQRRAVVPGRLVHRHGPGRLVSLFFGRAKNAGAAATAADARALTAPHRPQNPHTPASSFTTRPPRPSEEGVQAPTTTTLCFTQPWPWATRAAAKRSTPFPFFPALTLALSPPPTPPRHHHPATPAAWPPPAGANPCACGTA
jgi:hypothetical protein